MIPIQANTKTVAVVDVYWVGSLISYHKAIVDAFLQLGYQVISLSPNPQDLEAYFIERYPDSSVRPVCYLFEYPLWEEGILSPFKKHPSVKGCDQGWTWRGIAGRFSLVGLAVFKTILNTFKTGFLPGQHWNDAIHLLKTWSKTVRFWWSIGNYIKRVEQDLETRIEMVFFPWTDDHYYHSLLSPRLLDSIFPYQWSGLYLWVPDLTQHVQWGKLRRYEPLLSKNCKALAIINEFYASQAHKALGLDKKILMFPDITNDEAPDRDDALVQQIQAEAAGRKVIGLFGELSKRKGLIAYCQLVQAVAQTRPDWFFVIAGPLDQKSTYSSEELAELQILLRDLACPNLLVALGRITDGKKFNGLMNACDVIYAVYPNFPHSSNMLTKAALLRKPVVVNQGYVVAQRTEKYGLGIAVSDGGDIEQIESAIDSLLEGNQLDGQPLTPQYDTYYALHSFDHLKTTLQELMQAG